METHNHKSTFIINTDIDTQTNTDIDTQTNTDIDTQTNTDIDTQTNTDSSTNDTKMNIEIITSSPHPESLKTNENNSNTFDSLKDNIKKIENVLTSMKEQLSSIETCVDKNNDSFKQQKIKDTKLFKGNNNNIKPKKVKLDSGFNIQRQITPELCDFMNLETGSMTSIAESTKFMMDYINTHKLQDTTNMITRKYIKVDESLCKLFNIFVNENEDENKKITYFNIHKYIYQHFIDQH